MTTGDVLVDTLTVNGGKVGIGTTTPSKKFHIYGDNGTDMLGLIESPNDSASLALITGQASGDYAALAFRRIQTSGDGWNFGMGPTNNNFVVTSRVSNTNTDRMVIDTSGNVGIGTTSPTSLLQISSRFKFDTTGRMDW